MQACTDAVYHPHGMVHGLIRYQFLGATWSYTTRLLMLVPVVQIMIGS